MHRFMGNKIGNFWIREIGTGQQVAQLHERYMMIMMKIGNIRILWRVLVTILAVETQKGFSFFFKHIS